MPKINFYQWRELDPNVCNDNPRGMKSFGRFQRTNNYTHIVSTIHFDTSLQVLLQWNSCFPRLKVSTIFIVKPCSVLEICEKPSNQTDTKYIRLQSNNEAEHLLVPCVLGFNRFTVCLVINHALNKCDWNVSK